MIGALTSYGREEHQKSTLIFQHLTLFWLGLALTGCSSKAKLATAKDAMLKQTTNQVADISRIISADVTSTSGQRWTGKVAAEFTDDAGGVGRTNLSFTINWSMNEAGKEEAFAMPEYDKATRERVAKERAAKFARPADPVVRAKEDYEAFSRMAEERLEMNLELMAMAETDFLASAAGDSKRVAETKARFVRERAEFVAQCQKEKADLYTDYTNALAKAKLPAKDK